ncbi:sensor histidine kinase [Konateibacter massiliensis]|uniref:sensor histidine kinase n=1 Tax=Konateibacter massiliensis TaxID=2002841 RepID=UPI0015D479BD|nr:sensor histidine kinase [Konateibacter massiliensis]
MKLKTKFLIIFLLISNIPILIITSYTYNKYTELIHAQTTQVSENVFNNAKEFANSSIANINHIAEIFSFYSGSNDTIIEDLKKYAKSDDDYTPYDLFQSNNNLKFICQNLIYSSSYINGIFVFTPSGAILGYGYGGGIDIRPDYLPFDDEWYQNTVALKGKTYVDGVTKKDFLLRGEPSISFSRALYDVYTHEFLGVLFIDCSEGVFDLSSVNTLPSLMLLSIQDENGYILYTNVDDLVDNFTSKTTQKKSVSLDIDGLTLHSAVNYTHLYQQFNYTRTLIIVIGIICAVVFFVISILLSHSLTQPITYLSNKMSNRLGHNKVNREKYLIRTDEIGILANEYNHMIDELDTFIKNEYQNKLITLDSQMKSLEAQINSHFLYNTLESINSIAEIEEVESIAVMSLALGNMFRYSIKTQSELVTIEDELNHVRDYVAIQKIRFDNKFDLVIDLPEGMPSLRVLKLIMQPIVENALYHGLNYCNLGSYIKIHGYVKESNIYIDICDDGAGMSREQVLDLENSFQETAQFTELGHRNKQSIGLKNIHTRIALYYGQGYGLSVQSTPGEGTIITIKLPLLFRS